MTLRQLGMLRQTGQRPGETVWLLCGIRAMWDREIACTGAESPGDVACCVGLDIGIRHADWSPDELSLLIQRVLSIGPRTLAMVNDVTREWIMFKLSTGEIGAWDVTEDLQR